jgi:hypothetical protein
MLEAIFVIKSAAEGLDKGIVYGAIAIVVGFYSNSVTR